MCNFLILLTQRLVDRCLMPGVKLQRKGLLTKGAAVLLWNCENQWRECKFKIDVKKKTKNNNT